MNGRQGPALHVNSSLVCTAYPGKGLFRCELLAIPAAAAAGVFLNVYCGP